MNVLIITGTVREGNYTDEVAEKLVSAFSKNHDVEAFFLSKKDVPPMKHRLQYDENPPESVNKFQELVNWSDVIIPVTPEYNHSIPGPLKNLIDYLYEEYSGKYFCPVTVSAGGFGGVRAQSHLNDIILALNGRPGPSLHVSNVRENFRPLSEEYEKRLIEFEGKVESLF